MATGGSNTSVSHEETAATHFCLDKTLHNEFAVKNPFTWILQVFDANFKQLFKAVMCRAKAIHHKDLLGNRERYGRYFLEYRSLRAWHLISPSPRAKQ